MRGVFIFYVLFFIEESQKEDIEDEVLKLNLELWSKNSEKEESRTFQDKGLVFEKIGKSASWCSSGNASVSNNGDTIDKYNNNC